MSPAWIRKRDTLPTVRKPKGKRSYQVLYRRGGRAYKIETAGTFPSEREAKIRRDLVAGWLAQGLNPKTELARLNTEPAPTLTLAAERARYVASRVDAADNTVTVIRSALNWLGKTLDHRDPATVTVADLQDVVALMAHLKPSTIDTYVTYWAAFFDYLAVTPNPAESKHLKLPAIVREEISPPTGPAFLAVLGIVPTRFRLPLVVLEQTAMRIGELETLTWADVDEVGNQFRLRSVETKSRRPRWVQLPEWLMTTISASTPLDDRSADRRVFKTFSADAARRALTKACTTAGVPAFTPHQLRHRRTTIWHHEGLPVRVLMERGGWSRSEIPLEVYSHLMHPGEVPAESLERVLVMPR